MTTQISANNRSFWLITKTEGLGNDQDKVFLPPPVGGFWQPVGLFGQNCAILPQTILPDRIRSRLFAPWRTVYISPQSNGIWRQKRDEGILVNQPHTGFLPFLLNFKEGKNAISYLLTGICGRLQWWTSLASFLMFTGVGTHEPAGQNSTRAEKCGIWGLQR